MVCDKTNQRIQGVFKLNGNFLGNFGTEAINLGELLYRIVVTIAFKYFNKS